MPSDSNIEGSCIIMVSSAPPFLPKQNKKILMKTCLYRDSTYSKPAYTETVLTLNLLIQRQYLL